MRDTLKPKEYFSKCIETDKKRVQKFLDALSKLEDENTLGRNRGKLYLSGFYRNLFKLSYSVGEEMDECAKYYMQYAFYYKDVCTPNDSLYDIIDVLSIGVLLNSKKEAFIDSVREIVAKFESSDGMVQYLMGYLENQIPDVSDSQISYFNELMASEDKKGVLLQELDHWYDQHKEAYWYDAHKSKNDVYCGYWSFEVAAFVKIFGIEDLAFREKKYYPSDLVHLA